MPKQSSFLKKIQAEQDRSNLETMRFTRQNMMDVSMVALNEEFGFGEERLHRFAEKVQEVYCEYADLWNTDTRDVTYARGKMDRALKQICGKHFLPWDERYS